MHASYLIIAFLIVGVIFIQRKESTHKSILQEKDDIIEKQKIHLAYMSTKTNEALGSAKTYPAGILAMSSELPCRLQ